MMTPGEWATVGTAILGSGGLGALIHRRSMNGSGFKPQLLKRLDRIGAAMEKFTESQDRHEGEESKSREMVRALYYGRRADDRRPDVA